MSGEGREVFGFWISVTHTTHQHTHTHHHPISFISYGGIGGLSEALGWTDVQREDGKGLFGGPQRVIQVAALIAVLDSVWFGFTAGPAMLDKFLHGQ